MVCRVSNFVSRYSGSGLETASELGFTPKLKTFIQLIAVSIMIDASTHDENVGESDMRFVKKKKKLLVKTSGGGVQQGGDRGERGE